MEPKFIERQGALDLDLNRAAVLQRGMFITNGEAAVLNELVQGAGAATELARVRLLVQDILGFAHSGENVTGSYAKNDIFYQIREKAKAALA